MNKITVLFTKRPMNPVSWLIRWACPRSRFALSLSSHCVISDGMYIIQAHMLHGVFRTLAHDALKGLAVVRAIEYEVPYAEAGLAWLRQQVGKPYDWRGAFGVALSPYRDWVSDDRWFCYELAAGTIKNAGRDVFAEVGHMNESVLLAIKPSMLQYAPTSPLAA